MSIKHSYCDTLACSLITTSVKDLTNRVQHNGDSIIRSDRRISNVNTKNQDQVHRVP